MTFSAFDKDGNFLFKIHNADSMEQAAIAAKQQDARTEYVKEYVAAEQEPHAGRG